jgi:lactate racemase
MASGNVPSELGAFDGVETPRIQMTLTTGIPEERCRRVDLGHAGHRAIDSWRWVGREQMINESNP